LYGRLRKTKTQVVSGQQDQENDVVQIALEGSVKESNGADKNRQQDQEGLDDIFASFIFLRDLH